ncbi:hypothetical protein [Rhodoferax sp. OV413]|uniref:hypothetical protein n=1 Tax=Rhodoferax sp. OV413 TaxID=1855285 RepID=UPI0025FDDD98|nr:hypothetical protein [Rhodoferax sp. OV413]
MQKSAALPVEAAHLQVSARWIDLQARLMLVIEEVGAEHLQCQLRSQGVRRPVTVANDLAKELKGARAMAESMGICVTDQALHRRVHELPRSLNYQFNLRELHRAYEALLADSATSDEVSGWIKSRMSIHEFQLEQFGLH